MHRVTPGHKVLKALRVQVQPDHRVCRVIPVHKAIPVLQDLRVLVQPDLPAHRARRV